MEAKSTLANATLQQHLTVVRLFHDFLVEERASTKNPLRPLIGGRGLSNGIIGFCGFQARKSGRNRNVRRASKSSDNYTLHSSEWP
jgi:hypothetical protein